LTIVKPRFGLDGWMAKALSEKPIGGIGQGISIGPNRLNLRKTVTIVTDCCLVSNIRDLVQGDLLCLEAT
jgi:hypothetical protein